MASSARTGRGGRSRAVFWVAVLVAVLLLIGGSVVAATSYGAASGPDDVVLAYFGALRDGSASRALAYGDLPAGSRALLTGDVVQLQSRIAPIDDVAVVAVSRAVDQATVTLQYQLGFATGPEEITDTIPLVHRAGRWRLAEAAVPMTMHFQRAQHRLAVATATIPSGTVLVFPGAIPVTFDTPSLQLAADARVVRFRRTAASVLPVDLSPTGRTQITAALSGAVRRCVTSADARCPLSTLPPGAQPVIPGSLRGSVRGDLARTMTVRLANGPDGRVDITATATVVGSYQQLDFENVPVTRSGTVTVPLRAHCWVTSPTKIVWDVA
jgi:hypothetical protein